MGQVIRERYMTSYDALDKDGSVKTLPLSEYALTPGVQVT